MTYEDPLIPPNETREETLTRLSANIGTLTDLIDHAGQSGQIYLAGMFTRSRSARVEQARALIALPTENDKAADEPPVRRPLAFESSDWKKPGTGLNIAADLIYAGADKFAVERRFMLVGNSAPVSGTLELRRRGLYRPQGQRALTDGSSWPADAS